MDLAEAISALEAQGFRLDVISPADDPRTAHMSGHDLQVELRRTLASEPPADDSGQLVVVDGGTWGVGRAGMEYRDLIPGRHGGAVIASHIRIPDDGPVPDVVHHHDVGFQMIFCRRGAVRLVYEDQGEPFWIEAGDCVLQPPHIRHRVLESRDGLEVVELALPAEHPTLIDHDLELPTAVVAADRSFGGQRFCVDRALELEKVDLPGGWSSTEFGIGAATDGLATVRTIRSLEPEASLTGSHTGALSFFYVLDGHGTVECDGAGASLGPDSSISVPRGREYEFVATTNEFELLHVEVTDSVFAREL